MAKIFVSTFPFCRNDSAPLDALMAAGHDVVKNPHARKLTSSELVDLASDCDAIVAGTEDLLPLVQNSKKLKMIARVGVGLDSVPLSLCKSKGIRVAYTPDAVTPAVAELTIGLMLDLIRKVSFADREMRKGAWSRPYGTRIAKSSIGIIGFGRIGKSVTRLLTSFRPEHVFVNDLIDQSAAIASFKKEGVSITQVSLDELLKQSDIVTLHVPKTQKTENMISKRELASMKKTAFLINTARGGIINEDDLYDALHSGKIAGAAIDVFNHEPYRDRLTTLENALLTQHMGSCAEDCRADMEREACEDAVRFLSGAPLASEVIIGEDS